MYYPLYGIFRDLLWKSSRLVAGAAGQGDFPLGIPAE
jgi:hypothetical protein